MLVFENLGITKSRSDLLAEVAVELVGNALEHSRSDCFLDIDVTPRDYVRRNDPTGPKYYGVNICVVNFLRRCSRRKYRQSYALILNYEIRATVHDIEIARNLHASQKIFREGYGDDEFLC